VTALSKLSIVRSASESTEAIGPKACAGSLRSRAVRSVKCTSPAKASVTSPPGAAAGEAEDVARPDGGTTTGVAPQAASAARRAAAGNTRSFIRTR